MRKFTLLSLTFLVSTLSLFAQTNLVTNPGFETWTDGSKPDSWIFDKTTATLSKESSIVKSGSASLKIVTTATYWVTQNVPVTPGTTYTISLNYYIGAGDGTDFRIWSNFININGTTTTYNKMSLTDSLALKGPGGNTTTGYFADEKGAWKTYSYTVTAPAGYNYLQFQVRTYTGSTIYLDDFSVTAGSTTNTTNPSANSTIAYVSGKDLVITNVANQSAVEIFSALGSKVKSATIENGKVDISDLSKGLYIVRSGKLTQKFVIK